eukprot:3298386-Prymnesium_polylepis.1
MAACCAAPRTERRSRVGCRSGGVQAHDGVRAALEARPVPSVEPRLLPLEGEVGRGRHAQSSWS